MTEEKNSELSENTEQPENTQKSSDAETIQSDDTEELKKELAEANDKFIRLYADFENYKKITARNKEELLKYANEDLLSDILTVIDHLELALQHSTADESSSSLAEGVELTLKELKNVLEKQGLVTIEALGKPFDPKVHHAMSQIESDDEEENTVIREFRKGYLLKDRVLRAAMVGVAIKKPESEKSKQEAPDNTTQTEEK
jgi:molecular chaperone GrpE